MTAVNIMIKPASGLCNMTCSYCFYADEMSCQKKPCLSIMSEETLEIILKKLSESSAQECTIAFQGGEPVLAGLPYFRRCMELADKYLSGIRIHYSLQTNGYALDREWCQFFLENHFLIGVSLDGIKATHDANRRTQGGEGTYETIMRHIGLLKEFGVDFNILTVVNHRTAPRIRRIYENYRKNGFAYQQYIACLDPFNYITGETSIALTAEEYGAFLCELFDLWYCDLQQGTQPYIRQFESYISILLGFAPGECEHRGICGCQNVIEADGSVYPCDFYVLDDLRLGNVKEAEFQYLDSSPEKEQFTAVSRAVPEECMACRYYRLCRNGCRRLRLPIESGGRNKYCSSYYRFFEQCFGRLERIAEQIRIRKG